MIKHINFQTINHNGKPAFVIIPYDEFLHLYPQAQLEPTIPHDVVRIMVDNEISLLRAWREYLGLTQREVAQKLAITQAALSQIEAPTSKPRKETLKKLAAIYNLSVDQLR